MRKDHNLSQKQLADQLHVTHSQISRIESGETIDVENTINAIELALLSPYNGEDYQRDYTKQTSYSIHNFLNYCIVHYDTLSISQESSQRLNGLINRFLKR